MSANPISKNKALAHACAAVPSPHELGEAKLPKAFLDSQDRRRPLIPLNRLQGATRKFFSTCIHLY
jgi:hypothetical protein